MPGKEGELRDINCGSAIIETGDGYARIERIIDLPTESGSITLMISSKNLPTKGTLFMHRIHDIHEIYRYIERTRNTHDLANISKEIRTKYNGQFKLTVAKI